MSPISLLAVLLVLLSFASISYETECSNGTTCYQNGTEPVSCCHYKNGVCCLDDGQFCCPPNSECNLQQGICITKNRFGIPKFRDLVSMVPTIEQQIGTRLEICSDTLNCPGGSECCPAPFIGHDCCPLSNGICCGDFRHCCPSETRCDLKARDCIVTGNSTRIPWYKKTRATESHIEQIVDNIKCLDNKTICYDSDTCCPIGGGTYGCCPLPNAVCCSDQRHCCPSGMQCDPQTGSCTAGNDQQFRALPILKTIEKTKKKFRFVPQKANPLDIKNIICPGGEYTCPDQTTCCNVGGSPPQYGCCPIPNAVCCADNRHCCPHGSVCDVIHATCIAKDGRYLQIAKKQFAKKVTDKTDVNSYYKKENNVDLSKRLCPNNQTCPDAYTCCQLPSLTTYGCCPYSNAVCCDDHVHCCPDSTVCDLASRGCRKGNEITLHPLNSIMTETQLETTTTTRTNSP